ncbi:MAG: zinc-binding dehydrogenase, partial [Pseudomonadota bacterium]
IGLGAALVLRSLGVKDLWLAEPLAARRAVVAGEGIAVFDPVAEPGPDGVDLVIDGVGIPATRKAASAAVRPGGAIVHIGLGGGADGYDIRRITLQEIAVLGSYTYTPADFRATAAAMFDGRLGPLTWPEIRPLSQGVEAFDAIAAGQSAAPKIILEP